MKLKYIIEDYTGIQLYNKTFDSYDDAWAYIYGIYPVIENEDGTTDDREEILDEHWVKVIQN